MKKYRVTIEHSYHRISFTFEGKLDASAFAWKMMEQADDEIKVTLSLVKEDEEDTEE